MNVRLLYVYIFAEHIHEKQTSQCEKKEMKERKKVNQMEYLDRSAVFLHQKQTMQKPCLLDLTLPPLITLCEFILISLQTLCFRYAIIPLCWDALFWHVYCMFYFCHCYIWSFVSQILSSIRHYKLAESAPGTALLDFFFVYRSRCRHKISVLYNRALWPNSGAHIMCC